MKRKDVKAGVVYAYRQGEKWADIHPIVVVEVEYLYHESSRLSKDPGAFQRSREPGGRASIGYGGHGSSKTGMLAMALNRPDGGTSGMGFQEVTDATLGLLERTAAKAIRDGIPEVAKMSSGKVRLYLIDPRFIVGEYDEVMAERDIKAQAARERKAAKDAESAARVAAARQRVDALRALDLPGQIATPKESWSINYGMGRDAGVDNGNWTGNTKSVTLTWDQVDALLSLIPEGARYEPPAAPEADEWEYAEPEGHKGESVHVKDEENPEPEPEPVKRRTTGKSNIFIVSMHSLYGHLEFMGVPERTQPWGTLLLIAPTKAAAADLLVERGYERDNAERIASGSKMSRLSEIGGHSAWTRYIEAGLIGEGVRDALVAYSQVDGGRVARVVDEWTLEVAGIHRVKRTGYGTPDAHRIEVVKPGKGERHTDEERKARDLDLREKRSARR